MTALYTSGTISLVNGSAVITGIDTAWKTALIVGGTVHVEAEGNPLPILPDDSAGASEHPITDTEMTAAIKWQGATGTYKYALVRENTYTEAQAANSVKIAELLQRLNHPTIAAIAGIQGAQDHLILLTGASTATVIPRTSLIQGIEANATVETPAGLVTYESEAAGFIVLVSNAGDQRAALYFKLSATAGDWSDPAFLTGEQGIKGDTGDTGIRWRGAWNNVDAYAKNDVVRNIKSAWIALRANTNVSPPGLPTEANADWELFARAGLDGTGTGDVVGPDGGVVANDLLVAADATGKLLKKAPNNVVGNALLSQLAAPAIKGRMTAGTGDVEDLTPAQANQLLGGWEPIANLNMAGQSVLQVLNLSAFQAVRINYQYSATGSEPYATVSSDNGSTWQTGATDYRYGTMFNAFNGTSSSLTGDDASLGGMALGPSASSGELTIYGFNKGRVAQATSTQMIDTPSSRFVRYICYRIISTSPRNALQIASSAVISWGEAFIEGIRG